MPKPITLAWLSIPALLGVSLWGWSVDPLHPGRWLFVALFLPALWAFVEKAQSGDQDRIREREQVMNWHRLSLAWAAIMLALVVASKLAVATGLVDAAWEPIFRRTRGILFGVSMMVWGNYLPKLLSPWSLDNQPFDWQQVHRFVGWGAALGGIAVVLVWLALPVEEAGSASRVVVGLTCGLALGRKLLSVASPPQQRSTPQAGRT